MPDRIVRVGIITSEPVNALSWPAEVFYRRLMSVADDFGRYDGRPGILRAALYPLKLNNVCEADVEKWMLETAEAGLVSSYTVGGKPFVEIAKFNQRVRASKSKWPSPADNCPQSADNCGPPPNLPNTNTHFELPSKRGEAGGERNILPQLRQEVGKHFNRGPDFRWSYEEESYLVEVCKRPGALEEWTEILGYYRQEGSFPKHSVRKLLEHWGEELDKARTFKPEPAKGAPEVESIAVRQLRQAAKGL